MRAVDVHQSEMAALRLPTVRSAPVGKNPKKLVTATAMEFDKDAAEFREHVARWVDERPVPQADALDRSGEFPRELFREAGELDYFGVMYPERYGGSGAPNPHLCFTVLCEELPRGSMGFAAGGGTSDIMRLIVARQLGL